MKAILFGAVALCALLPTIAWSVEAKDEDSITMKDVPAEVKAAAQAAGNGLTFEKVGLDLDNGTATYELAGKGADGKMIEIDVLSDGTIEEVEQEISMDNVPDAVKKMLAKYMPKFKADKAERARARTSKSSTSSTAKTRTAGSSISRSAPTGSRSPSLTILPRNWL